MLKRTDPHQSHPELKEAICESLVNNLYGVLSGGKEEGREVVNNKPSTKFISGFLEPLSVPLNSNMSVDAARNPIHVITQGLDMQVSAKGSSPLALTTTFSIYVRLLPTAEQVNKHKVKLELNTASTKVLKDLRRQARDKFDTEHASLKAEDKSEYFKLRKEAEKAVVGEFLSSSGVELIEAGEVVDASPSEADALEGFRVSEGEVPEALIIGSSEEKGEEKDVEFLAYPGMSSVIPDKLVKPVMPTQRWYRLDITDIPPFVLDVNASEQDIKAKIAHGNTLIKEAINRAILSWLDSDEPEFGGKLWAYPIDAEFEPSKIKDWTQTLQVLRNEVLCHAELGDVAVPNLDIRWEIGVHANPGNRDIKSVHIAIENKTNNEERNKQSLETEEAIFLTHVSVSMDKTYYRPIQMDRIKPSYRYNRYLSYPALGFNCGIHKESSANQLRLSTTWMPIYRQPRIKPIERDDVDVRFVTLVKGEGIVGLISLPDQFDEWIQSVESHNPTLGVSSDDEAIRETESFKTDLSNWRLESKKIRVGIELLQKSCISHSNDPTSEEAMPFLAWVYMNETMSRVADNKFDRWRLFQIAFILSQISGITSRIPSYESAYDPDWDEAVALLYFATGGGKTESFFWLITL